MSEDIFLVALVAAPFVLAALAAATERWWLLVVLVVGVAGVAVWVYIESACGPDDYCDEARGFWAFAWLVVAGGSALAGFLVGALIGFLRQRRDRRRGESGHLAPPAPG